MSIWHILAIGFGGIVLLNGLSVALMAWRFRTLDRLGKRSAPPTVLKRAGGLSLVENPPKERRNA